MCNVQPDILCMTATCCKNVFFVSFCVLFSYLGQFKHGFQGRLIFNKVIFHVSIISQISKTLDSPLPCFGIYLGIAEPPRRRKKETLMVTVF